MQEILKLAGAFVLGIVFIIAASAIVFYTGNGQTTQTTTLNTTVASTSIASTATSTAASTSQSTSVSTSISTTTSIPQGLSAYWKFDEGSGTTASDASGNSNAAILVNSPSWDAGKTGGALKFNGVNQYISTSYYGIAGQNPRTFVAWVKVNGTCFRPICDILTYGGEAPGARIEWTVEGNGVGIRTYASFAVYSTGNVSDGNWHLLALVLPENSAPINAQIYQDGQILTTVSASQFITSPINTIAINPVNIGRMYAGALVVGNPAPNGANYFNGTIDDLRIYNRTLTANEIMAIYNGTRV